MLTYETILERIRDRTALDSEGDARAALRATLAVLGEGLSRDEARAVAGELPAPLGEILRDAHFVAPLEARSFYDRVTAREGAPAGMAVEHAQVICQVLAELLAPETRRRLASAIPAELSELFAPRATPAPPEARHPHPAPAGAGHTLAGGRPGSREPLGQASADRAHSGSVARDSDSRGPYKISTGHPRSNEGHTLADGKPGSDHPVSEND